MTTNRKLDKLKKSGFISNDTLDSYTRRVNGRLEAEERKLKEKNEYLADKIDPTTFLDFAG